MADEPKVFPPSPEFQKNAYFRSMDEYEAAYKRSEIRLERDQGEWFDSDTSLLAARVEYHTVYDWDMATRGDPLADLGTLMAVWYDEGEMPASLNPMPTLTPGFMSRAEAIARYAERSGRDLDRVDWYVVFGTFKLAVVLQQIYIRWLRGQTQDERFSVMGEGARRLFELAGERRG